MCVVEELKFGLHCMLAFILDVGGGCYNSNFFFFIKHIIEIWVDTLKIFPVYWRVIVVFKEANLSTN